MNFTLTIDFSPAVQTFLTALLSTFGGAAPAADKKPAPVKQMQSVNNGTTVKADPAPASTPAADNSGLTVEALRAIVQAKTQGNAANGKKVVAILAEFGVKSLTNLDAEHYPAFKTAIDAI